MRMEAFIIWGHGLPHLREILAMLREHPALQIVRIVRHHPPDIAAFVRQLYSVDAVPLEHLEGKTRYLLKTPPEVAIVFARNSRPRERYYGDGPYRTRQCETIKQIKEDIRNRFNPRIDGKRTEEHVIHAADVQPQADQLLRDLGFAAGLADLERRPNAFVDAAYHLAAFDRFQIRKVPMEELVCSILRPGPDERPAPEFVPVEQTPHYQFLAGRPEAYEQYLARYQGSFLTEDHGPETLSKLARELDYLQPPHEDAYLVVQAAGPDRFVIRDGVHRACVLRSRGHAELLVAVIP
ncbi:MAG: hypothetical protein V3T70_04785 [Phycisphaerae bacterium]